MIVAPDTIEPSSVSAHSPPQSWLAYHRSYMRERRAKSLGTLGRTRAKSYNASYMPISLL
jgi:hypothetical protein